jgi:hypothetical protein
VIGFLIYAQSQHAAKRPPCRLRNYGPERSESATSTVCERKRSYEKNADNLTETSTREANAPKEIAFGAGRSFHLSIILAFKIWVVSVFYFFNNFISSIFSSLLYKFRI